MLNRVLPALLLALAALPASAQEWTAPVRGSWVQTGAAQPGDVTLVSPTATSEIVIAQNEHSAVQHAARLLATDIEKISGRKPALVTKPGSASVRIHLVTLGNGRVPAGVSSARLKGQWEAYQVYTEPKDVWLVGSDFRGTAFAAFTLSERLGIDPLYIWTGYTPAHRNPLVLRKTNSVTSSPTFKYRGMFHDDEDILPRPFDPRTGYPYVRGTVPDEWYERFFETALRLRMNQVAPFTRAFRPFHVQKMASDWGLFYTSHHYDVLLSNPYGFDRFNLAKERGVTGGYDYINNKAMVEKYWRAGVQENRDLDAIYPVGLRATDDYGYNFPPGTTLEQKAAIYQQVIADQVKMAKEILPKDKTPLFHLTLYNEMMEIYRKGGFDLPSDVMLIWDDNGDGVMRDLPDSLGKWKHGVYYHLAFFGNTSKQSVHTVTPMRIASEFKKVVSAGATEYLLVNVSELREHVMETRMLAEIAWDAPTALSGADPAARYIEWWCREYFGDTAPLAARAYADYHRLIGSAGSVWYGSTRVANATMQLMLKLNGEPFQPLPAAEVATLKDRLARHQDAATLVERTMARMGPEPRRFFFEHVWLGLALDFYPTQAALLLNEALLAPDNDRSRQLMAVALTPLQKMEEDIRRAERPPFEGWYRATWIRPADFFRGDSRLNVHRPYDMLLHLIHGRTRARVDGGRGPATPDEQARVDREMALRYSPMIRYDERDPFRPARVGYTVFRESGVWASASPRLMNLSPGIAAIVEYALYWDWDIQHLYELEHVYVHVRPDGSVSHVDASAHGRSGTFQPIALVDGTHPVLFSEPGKHAFSRDTTPYTPELREKLTRNNRDQAGSSGLLITGVFPSIVSKTPEDDARVRAYAQRFAYEPTFRFRAPERIPDRILMPWTDVYDWIPRRLNAWKTGLALGIAPLEP